jgi:hypothetical protein
MREPLAWVTENNKSDTILAIGKDSIFLAVAPKGELFNAQDMVRSGSDPKRVLPREYAEFQQEELLEIRHQRDSKAIRIRYVDGEKPRNYDYYFEDAKNAAEAVQAIAKVMKLSTEPREEMATVAAITRGPLIAAAIPLFLLGLTFADLVWGNPNAHANPRKVKLIEVVFRGLGNLLGPNGVLLLMAAILLAAFAYWYHRFVQRPVVDVYTAITS